VKTCCGTWASSQCSTRTAELKCAQAPHSHFYAEFIACLAKKSKEAEEEEEEEEEEEVEEEEEEEEDKGKRMSRDRMKPVIAMCARTVAILRSR
jgi:hypothetical protein